MSKNLLIYLLDSPFVGDSGLSPIIFILLIVCLIVVVGCIIWGVVIGSKTGKNTTVITITDEDKEVSSTTIEDIEPNNLTSKEE